MVAYMIMTVLFRANLAELVSPLRRIRSKSPFFQLAAHRIPTLWSLYRGLLRNSPTEDISFRIRALFCKNRHLTGTKATLKYLTQGYKWLAFFEKANVGDEHCQAVLSRYSRLISVKREKVYMLGLADKELEWQNKLRNRPILTGGFMRPTLFHGPLPRMKPQPIAISGMIRTRMKSRIARIEKQARLLADLELLAEERAFEMGLRQLVKTDFPTFYSDLSDYEQWITPIKHLLREIDEAFMRDQRRANRSFSPEMLEAIIEARRTKIRNKTREKERERRGEILESTLKRKRKGPPAHILAKMSPERRRMDKVARSLSEVGYVALVKRRLGMRLKDPEAGLELGEKENRSLLKHAARMLEEENRKRADEEQRLIKSVYSAAPRNGAICIDKISRPRQLSYVNQDSTRFNWRLRAPSRVKSNAKKDGKSPCYQKRLRPVAMGAGVGKPFSNAIQQYSEKFLGLVALEEAEDEALLRHRLATWSVGRLEAEGYCLTGMSAYWMQANQFGRPVATFLLGPGITLPEHKLENGSQIMVSRIDPLKEQHRLGSVLSRTAAHIRICFPDSFDELDQGVWRLDLGRPNLVYERMRNAISHLQHDPEEIEQTDAGSSSQYILQGTRLRDVILRTFDPEETPWQNHAQLQAPDDVTYPSHDVLEHGSRGKTDFADLGAFRHDQRILSWAKRYSRDHPIVMDGDPPVPLNNSQRKAMATMIGQRISLIQGPPGTGKTKTITETIKILKLHFEVPQPLLVCTYTNIAVDNLVEGLAKAGVKPLRVGFNGNVQKSLVEYSLDYKLETHPLHHTLTKAIKEEEKLLCQIRDLEKTIRELNKKLCEAKHPKKSMMERERSMKDGLISMHSQHKNLQRKIYALQQEILRETVAAADVICTTCVTAACTALNVVDFPVVFLDEASMSTEPASLIPIMKGSEHIALIGDHKQLPPVIVSQQAQADGLGMSLFERLTEEAVVPSVMLDVQYRMHPSISRFPAQEFYDSALINGTEDLLGNVTPGLDPPRSKHLLKNSVTGHRPSVVFIDHTGNESSKGRSRVNVMEGHIVASVVEDLLLNNENLRGQDIGIIAPYAAQIKLLNRVFNLDASYKQRFKDVLGDHRAMQLEQIEVKTVDGFEGREKEIIIFSTVRNNSAGQIGFLADRRRLNVGLTRAKRGLFVIGSIQTLQSSKISEDNHVIVRVGKGADSWRRYAQFLTEGGLVVTLTGGSLSKALYGHLKAPDMGQAFFTQKA